MAGAHRVAARASVALAAFFSLIAASASAPQAPPSMHDNEIAASLDGKVGNATRGRALLADRDVANCVLCHAVPDSTLPVAGNVGPSLAGVGTRLTVPELRLRIVDITRVTPDAVMPSYFRADRLSDVAATYRGRTVLTAQQVEDVVAYLATLK
jgi:sulfur-oxidizing protein SoxX